MRRDNVLCSRRGRSLGTEFFSRPRYSRVMPFVTSAAEVWAGGPRREPPLAPGRQDNALRPPVRWDTSLCSPRGGSPMRQGTWATEIRETGSRQERPRRPVDCNAKFFTSKRSKSIQIAAAIKQSGWPQPRKAGKFLLPKKLAELPAPAARYGACLLYTSRCV